MNNYKTAYCSIFFIILFLLVNRSFASTQPDGAYITYYENGQKNIEAHYQNGILEGRSSWWYQNGQKESEGDYKN